jgi:hypothetical protein
VAPTLSNGWLAVTNTTLAVAAAPLMAFFVILSVGAVVVSWLLEKSFLMTAFAAVFFIFALGWVLPNIWENAIHKPWLCWALIGIYVFIASSLIWDKR